MEATQGGQNTPLTYDPTTPEGKAEMVLHNQIILASHID